MSACLLRTTRTLELAALQRNGRSLLQRRIATSSYVSICLVHIKRDSADTGFSPESTLLVLSDNGLRTISACRIELFFPTAASERLCRAILAVMFNGSVIQSIVSQRPADSHRQAFICLMIEIESQLEAVLQRTARNVEVTPRGDATRHGSRPPNMKKHASMPALKNSYAGATRRAPNLMALPPSPADWSKQQAMRASYLGLPAHGMAIAQQPSMPAAPVEARQRASRSSLPARYHGQQKNGLRDSDFSHTTLQFAPIPEQSSAVAVRDSNPPSGRNSGQLRHSGSMPAVPYTSGALRHSGSVPVFAHAPGRYSSTTIVPQVSAPQDRRSRAISTATALDPAKREADRAQARACLEGTNTTSLPPLGKVLPSAVSSSISPPTSSPTSLQYHHLAEDSGETEQKDNREKTTKQEKKVKISVNESTSEELFD